MTEKLSVLKHHVGLIRTLGFGESGCKSLVNEVRRETEDLIQKGNFKFLNEGQKQKYTDAKEEIIRAVLDDNFQEIPDFIFVEGKRVQNFDSLCHNCPNFVSEDLDCRGVTEFEAQFEREALDAASREGLRLLLEKDAK